MTTRPTSVGGIQAVVRDHESVLVVGGRTKWQPRAVAGPHAWLETDALAGIIDYSAEECVLTAYAGTRLADLATVLAASGQRLPFDPPLVASGATLGGTVAAGFNGPGRHRYGGVRDFIIGVALVDGEGRHVRSGGKVVKNAAGFLLHHAVVGSFGQFGVLTDVSLKVFPAAEASLTLQVPCGGWRDAVDTLRRLTGAAFDLDAVDWFDDAIWVRIAGRSASIDARVERVRRHLERRTSVLDDDAAAAVWSRASELAWVTQGSCVVKVPTSVSRLCAADGPPAWFTAGRVVGGGSAVWVDWPEDGLDALAALLDRDGDAGVVVRGPDAGKRLGRVVANPFEARVRHAFDPQGRFRAASHSH